MTPQTPDATGRALVERLKSRLAPSSLDHEAADALTAALDRVQALEMAQAWQPIETAPKDGTVIIGALFAYRRLCRVHDMRHNGLAFYTIAGGSLPQMTHWIPRPPTGGSHD